MQRFILLLITMFASGCGLGPWELMMVLAIVVVLFGASRLPQLGKALGETMRNFKEGTKGGDLDEKADVNQVKPQDPAKLETRSIDDAELETSEDKPA